MEKLTKNNSLKMIVLAVLLTLLSACGGGGSGGGGVASNPDFIAKAEAVSFSRIELYEGHVNVGDINAITLDTGNLKSGELITIDVELEVTGDLTDYGLAIQLIPQSVFSLLAEGNNIADIFPDNSQQVEDFIDLGGVYIDVVQPGVLHGVLHAKLPVLQQDTVYKILITPSLEYLSSGQDINTNDIQIMPAFLDNNELSISKLDAISVKIVAAPDVTVDNEFTQLEIGGGFDKNGFSIEPVFQTSVKVDMTTFAVSEEIVFTLSWQQPGGGSFPLGLLTSDVDSNPVISTEAHFIIKKTDATSVTIPVVAYATELVQGVLLKQATNIRDIADQQVTTGDFTLAVKHVDNGVNIDTGIQHVFSIPLVSQNNSPLVLASAQVVGFTVLRAGNTNEACLTIRNTSYNIDGPGSTLVTDVAGEIIAFTCPATGEVVGGDQTWRYDLATKQIISKDKDINGDDYCIEWVDQGTGEFFPNDFNLRKCEFDSASPEIGHVTQRFIFEGNKLRLETTPLYVDVIFSTSLTKEVTLSQDAVTTTDIFRNTNGVDIDQYGRVFYVGKFYDRSWGNVNTAQAHLSYGGEAYVDLLPVTGATAQGHAKASAALFGSSTDLVDTSFVLKRYFPKKISVLGNNFPDVVVGNGAALNIDIAGFSSVVDLGGIVETTITGNNDPAEVVGNILFGMPEITDRTATPVQFKLTTPIVNTTFVVGFIPVTVKGEARNTADIKILLTSPGVGFDVNVVQSFDVKGVVSAQIIAAGIEGAMTLVDQSITYSVNGGFATSAEPDPTKLTFEMGSSLVAQLKLLQGEIIAFVEYPSLTLKGYVTKKKEKVIYSSPYLFNDDWVVFSKNINTTIIDY